MTIPKIFLVYTGEYPVFFEVIGRYYSMNFRTASQKSFPSATKMLFQRNRYLICKWIAGDRGFGMVSRVYMTCLRAAIATSICPLSGSRVVIFCIMRPGYTSTRMNPDLNFLVSLIIS